MQSGKRVLSASRGKKVKLILRSGKSVRFDKRSLYEPTFRSREISRRFDLKHLDLPTKVKSTLPPKKEEKKIFLGFGGNPNMQIQYPIWMPSQIFNSNIFIGGASGGGKTSLMCRLVAGALNTYGTVVLGEAKGGEEGYSDGAAFTELSAYLSHKILDGKNTYRWPRGNCWFNPLLALESKNSRRNDLENLAITRTNIKKFVNSLFLNVSTTDAQYAAARDRIKTIMGTLIEYMIYFPPEKPSENSCTLETLVAFLNDPKQWKKANKKCKKFSKDDKLARKQQVEIVTALTKNRFFIIADKPDEFAYGATAGEVTRILNLLNQPDLLKYTQPVKDDNGNALPQLKISAIFDQRSLVVISQPLSDDSAGITGAMFWDAMLGYAVKKGPKREGENVAVFLDETYRLPTSRLGDAAGETRQYRIGIVEVTPKLPEPTKWTNESIVYRTLISVSTGVQKVVQEIHTRLLPRQQKLMNMVITTKDAKLDVDAEANNNRDIDQAQSNKGVSVDSLSDTGGQTAIFHSTTDFIGSQHLFWLDLYSPLFEEKIFTELLQNALHSKIAGQVADYVLGLIDPP